MMTIPTTSRDALPAMSPAAEAEEIKIFSEAQFLGVMTPPSSLGHSGSGANFNAWPLPKTGFASTRSAF